MFGALVFAAVVFLVSGELYEYGADQQMTGNDLKITLTPVNYYDKKYNSLYVSKDGIVGLAKTPVYSDFNFSTGARQPEEDFPLVAPFHFNGMDISSNYQGKVFYRQTTSASFLQTVKAEILDDLSFTPTLAVVVTWENVTDKAQREFSSCQGTTSSPCPSCTFQLTLVASSEVTYVVLNYYKMDTANNLPYQFGINGGNGVGWTSACAGCDLTDLVSKSFIFKVSGVTAEHSGCSDTFPPAVLEIHPKDIMMFGGELLDVVGACIPQEAKVKCKFGNQIADGFRVNRGKARCPVPKLAQRGFVLVSLSTDDGQTYAGEASLYVVMPERFPSTITLNGGWYDVRAEKLNMTWDPALMTTDSDAKVDIHLIGYRETATAIVWKSLTTLATNVANTGVFKFNTNDHQCKQEDCELFEVGMVEVRLHKSYYQNANSRVNVNAGVVTLAWLVDKHMTSKHGTNWPTNLCVSWYDKDKKDLTWMNKLVYCPCSVEQAMADFGRWQPDVGCNMFSKSPSNCFYHKGALHCVRSFQPSSTGAGNQCCYGPDGLLKYAADTYQGSTPDKSHDWGAEPYNKKGYVPSLSHWIEDVVTFYYCCLWVDYSHCDNYMDLRATRDCNGYKPSKAAIAYGDPHITTFDGQMYNFGGKGDFYLLKNDGFTVQGKFRVNKKPDGTLIPYNATVLTSVAILCLTGTRVEIRLAAPGYNTDRKLDVFINKKIEFFQTVTVSKRDLGGGMSVINLADSSNNRQQNFTVLLPNGGGVQVAASYGLLHVIVNVPPNMKDKTAGLLGTWNDNKADDFTSKSGQVIDISSTRPNIYQNFAKTWMVPTSECLFIHCTEADDDFVPQYELPAISPGSGITQADVDALCADDQQCRFDYIVTGRKNIGNASLLASNWFEVLQGYQISVETCGLLDVPHSNKDSYDYTVGKSVTITGCRNKGQVSGHKKYTCVKGQDGTLAWQPAVSAKCVKATGGTERTTFSLLLTLMTFTAVWL